MESEEKQSIVIFPFMAQGHIIPFLALALRIEQKGYLINYVSTPLNIKKLHSLIPPNSSIRLVEIPFNSSDYGLPPDAENNDDLPYNLVLRLLEAAQDLEPSFRKILAEELINGQRKKPVCIIGDFFFGWLADVAHDFGIFHALFSGAGGFGLACYHSLWLNLPHRNTNDEKGEFLLPDFPEAGKFHVTQLSPSLLLADGTDPSSIFQRKCLPTWVNSDGFLFNTVEELDRIGLTYFRRKLGIPVWAIGPILLPVDERAKLSKTSGITPQECLEWLDSKSPDSVLYISFGSQTTISASQMMQLAKALDSGDTNFIWVIRPPIGFDPSMEFIAEDWLPEGFVQRVREEKKGLVVEKWAPQLEILSHKSVAAFLCHCGWNSVLESLINGVALIGWPIAGDQFYNAKLLAEWVGVCVEVARGISFEVGHEDIRYKIELVMGDNEKGKEMRRKAQEVKGLIEQTVVEKDGVKGDSLKAMEEFFSAALQMQEEETQLMEQSN
ncbi:OLC1v1005810C1 [Oldenlandia corymbosa var. corymbosa]|uniref:OLC1v1005810C1 n=1 Tax=Oldenlandia corymbosa var. corymbosa TaxID=529605 RepID=A0AAV1DHX6_OLDCO|nr:OLC1v1005810C1 [Oldenlandia corymbosa var. corymbosa]